jgi:AcrR family transcriptional regulator
MFGGRSSAVVRASSGSGLRAVPDPATAAAGSSAVEAAEPAAGAEGPAPRRARKDAARNHDALLAAATEAYAEKGVDCSLEEIARRAGVGIGTLYRHFPTRDALNEAVYRREVEALCDGAAALQADATPVEALAAWMRSFAGYVARKRGMATALKSALGPDNELFTYSHRRIRAALGQLVGAAVAAGDIRADVDSDDLLRAMSGICMATENQGVPDRVARIVDLLVDGLRYGAPAPS